MKKNIIIILSSTLTLVITIECIIYFIKKIDDNINLATSIINFIGTFTGGIVGAIVAFWVAKYQVDVNNKKELENQNKQRKNSLSLIKDELLYNSDVIDIEESTFQSEISAISKSLSSSIWNRVLINIELTPELLSDINICYRTIEIINNAEISDITYQHIYNLKKDIQIAIQKINGELNMQ